MCFGGVFFGFVFGSRTHYIISNTTICMKSSILLSPFILLSPTILEISVVGVETEQA